MQIISVGYPNTSTWGKMYIRSKWEWKTLAQVQGLNVVLGFGSMALMHSFCISGKYTKE